ncbi:hypothetical protein NL108_011175 [Boleophthalmus pectinirostris]|nr:hypothetical protein NL108_011175 [Boleophthalmus pectinirostris]
MEKPWKWSDNSSLGQFSYWGVNPWRSNTSMCGVEDQNHIWRPVSCSQRLPFFCYKADEMTEKKEQTKYTVVKVSFRSDLDMSDPNNYRLLTQKMEEKLNQPGVKVTWKTPPKKTTPKKNNPDNICPRD